MLPAETRSQAINRVLRFDAEDLQGATHGTDESKWTVKEWATMLYLINGLLFD